MTADRRTILAFAAMLWFAASCGDEPEKRSFRLGHFANVTHAQALVARAMSLRGDGVLEKHLGSGFSVEWLLFAAGPDAMDALLSGRLDATYVGPSPVIDAFSRHGNDGVRVLAGASNGGAALVVRKDAGIHGAQDFRGKRIATPQYGNTQDVHCRAWLAAQGYSVSRTGDVTIVSLPSAQHLELFRRGEIDAAWTVEPWVSRLEREGNGHVLVVDDALTAVLAASAAFVRANPDVVLALLAAHREVTAWIDANPAEAQALIHSQIEQLMGTPLEAGLVAQCWPRLRFSAGVTSGDFHVYVENSAEDGSRDRAVDLSRLLLTR